MMKVIVLLFFIPGVVLIYIADKINNKFIENEQTNIK